MGSRRKTGYWPLPEPWSRWGLHSTGLDTGLSCLGPPDGLTPLSSPAEYGEHRGGPESLDLPEDSQHLNPACYPSTCLTGILLSYKHPEVSFSMEQAGV